MTTAIDTQTLAPVVAGPGEDRAPHRIRLQGHDLLVKAMGGDTGGAFAIAVMEARPMSGPPLHVHEREDEWFYILKGELTFQVDDATFTAGPGVSVFAPRHIPHTWQNLTDGVVEALVMAAPAGIEEFFLTVSGRDLGAEETNVLATEFGIRLIGPPIGR